MNLENTGASYVFDAKTKESMEEAKNRLTLIEAETVRYSKLKKTLEGDIIKLEADLAYKTSTINNLEAGLQSLTEQIASSEQTLSNITSQTKNLERELNLRQNAITGQETELANKLHELQQQAIGVSQARSQLDKEKSIFLEQRDLFEQRKKTLETVLDSI